MAILGQDGRLQLVREQIDPQSFGPSALNPLTNALATTGTQFWTGDLVKLFSAAGLPTVGTPTGTRQWAGVGSYLTGPTRAHLVDDASQFWLNNDSVQHWEELDPQDPLEGEYYVHVDEFDRVTFYETLESSLDGSASGRVPILQVGWESLVMSPVEDFDADWSFLCNLRSWSFETESSAIDTTAIGVKFGEAVKSIVTGSGNLEFLIDRRDTKWNAIKTMRLAMLVDKGSKARAHFFLTQDDGGLDGKAIYYEADILIVASSISLRVDEAIPGSASFATTGPIALKVAAALQ